MSLRTDDDVPTPPASSGFTLRSILGGLTTTASAIGEMGRMEGMKGMKGMKGMEGFRGLGDAPTQSQSLPPTISKLNDSYTRETFNESSSQISQHYSHQPSQYELNGGAMHSKPASHPLPERSPFKISLNASAQEKLSQMIESGLSDNTNYNTKKSTQFMGLYQPMSSHEVNEESSSLRMNANACSGVGVNAHPSHPPTWSPSPPRVDHEAAIRTQLSELHAKCEKSEQRARMTQQRLEQERLMVAESTRSIQEKAHKFKQQYENARRELQELHESLASQQNVQQSILAKQDSSMRQLTKQHADEMQALQVECAMQRELAKRADDLLVETESRLNKQHTEKTLRLQETVSKLTDVNAQLSKERDQWEKTCQKINSHQDLHPSKSSTRSANTAISAAQCNVDARQIACGFTKNGSETFKQYESAYPALWRRAMDPFINAHAGCDHFSLHAPIQSNGVADAAVVASEKPPKYRTLLQQSVIAALKAASNYVH